MVGGILRAGGLRGSLEQPANRGGKMSTQTIRPWKRLLTDSGGQEIAEAALVLPIVFLLLIGIMTFARAYNTYTTITYAAQEGARLAAQSSSASLGNAQSTPTEVADRVVAVLQASSIDPNQIQDFSDASAVNACSAAPLSCKTTKKVTVCTNVAINTTGGGTVTGPTACGVTVSFKYPYTFLLPFVSVNGKTIHMIADVEIPEEN
jgi:Flp pilus assembly protein TadG